MKRGAALATGFGEDQAAMGEIESREGILASQDGSRLTPVEAAGDHQVKHEPEIAGKADGDALADTAQSGDLAGFDGGERRIDGAEQEGRADTDAFQDPAGDARVESLQIDRNIRQFGHAP
jgi:hypothetical protein